MFKTKAAQLIASSTTGLFGLLGGLLLTSTATASHMTVFNPIDTFDGIFNAGGGSFTTTLSSGADDAWFALGANAGDSLTINVTGNFGPNIVLFEAGSNGLIEIGDIYTPSGAFDGNANQTGTGIDLIVTSFIFDNPCSGDCYVAPDSATFSVLNTGQYVIGMSAANESSSFIGPSTIDLRGNTGNFSVPEPTTLALFGLGLIGFGLRRRKA